MNLYSGRLVWSKLKHRHTAGKNRSVFFSEQCESRGETKTSGNDLHSNVFSLTKTWLFISCSLSLVWFWESLRVSAGEPSALVVLVEEELVVIDLQTEGWPVIQTPYLVPLHSSAITCSHHVSAIPLKLWERIIAAGVVQNIHYSKKVPMLAGSYFYSFMNLNMICLIIVSKPISSKISF